MTLLKCPLYVLTGLQCPFCGTQRALLRLLHGDVLGAVQYNYFLVMLIPYALALAVAHRKRRPLVNKVFFALLCVWGVARNVFGFLNGPY